MKDEIKEMNFTEMLFNRDERLLQCILNLQEELKEYKMLFDAFSERPYAHRYLEEKKKELGNNKIIGLDSEMIYKDYYDLKEENERLKEITEEHKNCTRKHWQQKCAKHCANEMIYKSRIDEAIEVLKLCNSKCSKQVINILNGDEE